MYIACTHLGEIECVAYLLCVVLCGIGCAVKLSSVNTYLLMCLVCMVCT
jgi:hypothetical protein